MTQHLRPKAAETLQLELDERIEYCRADRWVSYATAHSILKRLDDLYTYPKTIRMPNVLLVGRSNNGKSSIVQHFLRRHPMTVLPDGRPGSYVAWISLPAAPTESTLWSEILWSLNIQHRERDSVEKKRRMALDSMSYANVRILAIDEFNHLVNAGKDASKLLATIKHLSTTLRISIIASGTQAAINALNSDPQMKSRFEAAVLDRWNLNTEYLRFLATYETLLPLAEPSQLSSRELAPLIYRLGGDTIGGTVKVLKDAAVHAIENGKERIDASILAAVREMRGADWDEVARRA